MEDAFTGLRPAGDADDPVVWWRREWERGVAAADASDGSGDVRLAGRRRDYGSYAFVALDLVLAFVGQIVLAIPLLVGTALLFVATGHAMVVASKLNAEFATWIVVPLFTLAGLFVTDGAMLLVLWHRLARQRLSWSVMGLGASSWRAATGRAGPGQAIVFGVGTGAAALVLSTVLGNMLQRLGLDQSGQDKLLIEPLKHTSPWIVLAMVLAGTFLAPAVEELFFRGYVFRAVAVRKGVPLAYLVSAGAFAAFHQMLALIPVLFTIGLLLCYAYRRTGNLLANITAHVVYNGSVFVLALLLRI